MFIICKHMHKAIGKLTELTFPQVDKCYVHIFLETVHTQKQHGKNSISAQSLFCAIPFSRCCKGMAEQAKQQSSGHATQPFHCVSRATQVAKSMPTPIRPAVIQRACLPINSKGYVETSNELLLYAYQFTGHGLTTNNYKSIIMAQLDCLCFKLRLKTHLFSLYQTRSALDAQHNASYKLTSYLLTYIVVSTLLQKSHYIYTVSLKVAP